MVLPVQRGLFGQDSVIANTRQKLAELYHDNPDIGKSEKRCILEFWSQYEQLQSLLGDKWEEFKNWFMNSTSPETITRCLRGLKEEGTIELTPRGKKQRLEKEKAWRSYWGKERTNGYQGGDGGG